MKSLFIEPAVVTLLRLLVHRIRCRRRHWYGYPNYMTDSFGHWMG